MENYSVYLMTEEEKYKFIDVIRRVGAKLTAVSGCGTGYYLNLMATPRQADRINRQWENR